MTLLQVHFLAAGFWLGLLAVETVLELHPRASESTIAVVHKWVDLLFEGPAVLLVLTTGALLLGGNWPAPPLLLLKAGIGLVPILANFYCFPLVLARARTTDAQRAVVLSRRIKLTGAAIPFVFAAFALGLYLR
ncbi:MAG: hypothetical protein IT518_15060 [Burkholderiales bacterium]|nr:hypothetical protein [Burkholderiales bacterium]